MITGDYFKAAFMLAVYSFYWNWRGDNIMTIAFSSIGFGFFFAWFLRAIKGKV